MQRRKRLRTAPCARSNLRISGAVILMPGARRIVAVARLNHWPSGCTAEGLRLRKLGACRSHVAGAMDEFGQPLPHRVLVAQRRGAGVERNAQLLAHVALDLVAQRDELLGGQMVGEDERADSRRSGRLCSSRRRPCSRPRRRAAGRRSWDGCRSTHPACVACGTARS